MPGIVSPLLRPQESPPQSLAARIGPSSTTQPATSCCSSSAPTIEANRRSTPSGSDGNRRGNGKDSSGLPCSYRNNRDRQFCWSSRQQGDRPRTVEGDMRSTLAVLLVICGTAWALAGSWSGWRGPTGQGFSTDKPGAANPWTRLDKATI